MIRVRWEAREHPLEPVAVVARGDAARALAGRISRGAIPWRGLVGSRLLLLEGAELPWSDGVTFLGAEEGSTVLHDTRLRALVHPGLLEAAAQKAGLGRVAWLHDPEALVPLGALDALDPAAVADWARTL